MLTLALDLRLAEGQDKVVALGLRGERIGGIVENLVLKAHDGIAVADGGLTEEIR